MRRIAALDGVDSLVGLLDHVVRDACVRLFAVPWTAVGRAQGCDDGDEPVERMMVDGIDGGHGGLPFFR